MLAQADKSRTTVSYIRNSTLTKSTISSLKIISSHSIKITSTNTANIFKKYYNKINSFSTIGKLNTYFKETQPHLH